MARKQAEVKDPADIAIANIEKALGNKGVPLIFKYGNTDRSVESISFGYTEVDKASNIGGVPKGKLIEIFGLPSAGKSFLTLKLIASAQAMGLKCVLVDAEQSFDPLWAARHGVDVENLYLINEALTAEKALDYVNALCGNGTFGLVVVDSTAALVPKKEMDGSVEDQDYALLARAMSKGCRKIVNSCGKTKCSCVFINQVRDDIGARRGGEVITCGGKALPFYAHQRISVWPGGVEKALGKDGVEQAIAKKSHVTFIKNKTAVPYGKCEISIVFDEIAMNPMVKAVTLAKSYKLFSIRLGEYYISKDLLEGVSKNYNTMTSTFGELTHWVLSNGYMEDVLFSLKELVDNEEDEDKLKLIDPVIYQLTAIDDKEELTNKDLWISPFGDYSIPTDPDMAHPSINVERKEKSLDNDDEEDILEDESELE